MGTILAATPTRRMLLGALGLGAASPLLAGCFKRGGVIASPAVLAGSPIRVGNRVYLLTNQWRDRLSLKYGTDYAIHGALLTDLWAFDAKDARPLWRVRLAQENTGKNMGVDILGAHDDVLWVLQTKGLSAVSRADGKVLADPSALEAANPQLKGRLPTKAEAFAVDNGGLILSLEDGAKLRLGPDLKAGPFTPAPAATLPRVTAPGQIAGGVGAGAFVLSYARLEPRWIGLLDEAAGQVMRRDHWEGWFKPDEHPRTKLWAGSFTGGRLSGDIAPLPMSPEFLSAGLLFDGHRSDSAKPFLLPDPVGGVSVLILHADKLGEGATLRLSRVSTATGEARWTTDLPATMVESVLPGDGSIVLVGRRREEGPKSGPNDVQPINAPVLLALDLATGKLGAYGMFVKATDAGDIPPSPIPA